MKLEEGNREGGAWGQTWQPNVMDRLGIWLSNVRIRQVVGSFRGKSMGDFGCGYQATFMRSVLSEVAKATLVDLAIADDLKARANVEAFEGVLPEVLERVPGASLDVVVCNNVLEHLWEPERALDQVRRILRADGLLFVNVPSWRGKVVLETLAFRLGLNAKNEINDHKHYYDTRELWQLMVRGGFKPSEIDVRTHKGTLNTYAVCRLGR